MTITEKNCEIAHMLRWTYVSSIDVKEGKYDSSIRAGWYSRLPKQLHLKVNNHLYRGRSHNNLRFDSDYNWMMEGIRYIKSLGYSYGIAGNKEKCACVIHLPVLNSISSGNCLDEREALFNTLYAFSQYLKDLGDIEEKRD